MVFQNRAVEGGGRFHCSLMNCLFQLLLLRRRNSEKWKNVTTLLHSGHSPWFEVDTLLPIGPRSFPAPLHY